MVEQKYRKWSILLTHDVKSMTRPIPVGKTNTHKPVRSYSTPKATPTAPAIWIKDWKEFGNFAIAIRVIQTDRMAK